MIFYDIKKDLKTKAIFYKSTWEYNYEYMLDFFQELIERDFKDRIEDIKIGDFPNLFQLEEELKKNDYKLKNCEQLKTEHDVLTIAGYSNVMKANIRITLFNKTNNVKLVVVDEKNKFHDREFDNYIR